MIGESDRERRNTIGGGRRVGDLAPLGRPLPGWFDDLARAGGADMTAPPLLVPDAPAPSELVEIVLDRYAASASTLA